MEHDKLDEADFLFGNFVYHNGLDVLNDISIKYNGLLYLKDLNINKSFYEHFDDKNGTSQFFINVIDNNNQIFKHNLSYSPHYIYKQIRLIIQDIYMTSCLNKYNKKLCCAVIHQIFDEFCGKKLVNSLINEIRPYETLLKSEELDGIVYDNFTQHFQSKLLLTSTEINQIIEKINLHDQDYWRCFGNIKHDFLIIDIFKKLSENNYVKDYVFSLLEKLLLDNDFTLLYEHLVEEVKRYNNDNSYYIKPIFLKIKSHGLGVSHFLNQFAESKNMSIENVDISSLSDYFNLIGLSATWDNGHTGVFYNMQQKNPNTLSILYLDNFDQFKNKTNSGNAFSNSSATINKIILKQSRLNYVDEFKLLKNEVVDISKIITICIGERFPDVCSKEVIGSFKVFEIDFYKHNDTENPNPILENIWNNVINEES